MKSNLKFILIMISFRICLYLLEFASNIFSLKFGTTYHISKQHNQLIEPLEIKIFHSINHYLVQLINHKYMHKPSIEERVK